MLAGDANRAEARTPLSVHARCGVGALEFKVFVAGVSNLSLFPYFGNVGSVVVFAQVSH